MASDIRQGYPYMWKPQQPTVYTHILLSDCFIGLHEIPEPPAPLTDMLLVFFCCGVFLHILGDQESSSWPPWMCNNWQQERSWNDISLPPPSCRPAPFNRSVYYTPDFLYKTSSGLKAPWQTSGHWWEQELNSCFQCSHQHEFPAEREEALLGFNMLLLLLLLGVVGAAECVQNCQQPYVLLTGSAALLTLLTW